jgi:hypothetical protein
VAMSLRVLAATAILLLFLLKNASSKEGCMTHLESIYVCSFCPPMVGLPTLSPPAILYPGLYQ